MKLLTHRDFKKDMLRKIRQHSKALKQKIQKKIYALRKDRSKVLNDHDLDKTTKREEVAIYDKRIKNFEVIKFARA